MASLVELAANVITSRAANTNLTADELIAEIGKVHTALMRLESGQSVDEAGTAEEVKAVHLTLKEAFRKTEVVCMVCGKAGFKTLARHLSTAHGMKPNAYRKQFGIPRTQALSAKNYSEARRKMAMDRGLADNLTKARAVRKANITARMEQAVKSKEAQGKPAKVAKAPVAAPAPVKTANTPAPAKAAKAAAPAPSKVTKITKGTPKAKAA